MTHRQFLRLLQADVNKAPTHWRAAERLDISESMLSRVLAGKQAPNARLLARYGLMATVAYVPIPRKRTPVKRQNADSGDLSTRPSADLQEQTADTEPATAPRSDDGPRRSEC